MQSSFLQTYTNPGKISQQRFRSGRKKVLNVKTGFPKNPSLATTLPEGGEGATREREGGSVWETEIKERCNCVASGGSCWFYMPPHLPLPWAEALGRPTGALWR